MWFLVFMVFTVLRVRRFLLTTWFEGEPELGALDELDAHRAPSVETTPSNLLSPSTCDKVRDWLMGFRQLGVPENVQAAELLKLLPEVE